METPYNFSEPNWKPLERAVELAGLPLATCGEFMWMQENPVGVHHYKHIDTRSYVRLTSETSAPACARDLKTARSSELGPAEDSKKEGER